MYKGYSCYSILECYNLFSGVNMSISVLFYLCSVLLGAPVFVFGIL